MVAATDIGESAVASDVKAGEQLRHSLHMMAGGFEVVVTAASWCSDMGLQSCSIEKVLCLLAVAVEDG